MKPRENETYMTTGDVARHATISNQAIDTAVKGGRLRIAFRTAGGMKLFRQEDVDSFCEARKRHRGNMAKEKGANMQKGETTND